MDLDLNFTGRMHINTSEDHVDMTTEDDIPSLAKSYMTFKIGLCFRYIYANLNTGLSCNKR